MKNNIRIKRLFQPYFSSFVHRYTEEFTQAKRATLVCYSTHTWFVSADLLRAFPANGIVHRSARKWSKNIQFTYLSMCKFLHALGEIHGNRSALGLDVSIVIDNLLCSLVMFHIALVHYIDAGISKAKGFSPRCT